MSDVEARIERWRASLVGSELLRQSDVSELESHLREEMEHLKTAGLHDDEAFLVARRRLGDPTAIEEEFAKVNTSERLLNRLWWMVWAILVYRIAGCCGSVIAQGSVWATYMMGLGVKASATSLILSEVVTFTAIIASSVWLTIRHFRHDGCRQIRPPTRRMVGAGLTLALTLPAAAFAIGRVSMRHLVTSMGPESYSRLILARDPVDTVWRLLMPVLLISVLAIISRRAHRRASAV
ncbi:MAG: permease prefix domain 1-containing protein [Phycisphaerales bacterium]